MQMVVLGKYNEAGGLVKAMLSTKRDQHTASIRDCGQSGPKTESVRFYYL